MRIGVSPPFQIRVHERPEQGQRCLTNTDRQRRSFMSLIATRQTFVQYSGRYDLVTDAAANDYTDNGADKFIKAGQKWLDTNFLIGRTRATAYQYIGVGGWYAIIPSCRVVHALWISNAALGRWEAERKNLAGLRQLFPGSLEETTRGRVEIYAPLTLRDVPEILGTITVDQLGQTSYTVAGEIYSYNGVLFAPPTNEAITLEIDGTF